MSSLNTRVPGNDFRGTTFSLGVPRGPPGALSPSRSTHFTASIPHRFPHYHLSTLLYNMMSSLLTEWGILKGSSCQMQVSGRYGERRGSGWHMTHLFITLPSWPASGKGRAVMLPIRMVSVLIFIDHRDTSFVNSLWCLWPFSWNSVPFLYF